MSLIVKNKIDFINDDKKDLKDLFYLIYDGKNQYFNLINHFTVNYKIKKKNNLKNYSHYYINLSFLIYSNYEKNNITLSLNEKLILEKINQDHNSFLEKHHIQIKNLLLSNEFIDLSKKVINQLKDILNYQQNNNEAKNLFNLSFLLKEMRSNKYKNNLLSHKIETNFSTKYLILACTIIYEELFNISLNNYEWHLRDNIQQLDSIFSYKSKNDNIISLSFNLNNQNCKIIRAGKDLYSYVNNNLFDIFPLIFKEYQIDNFISTILNNFNETLNKENNNNNNCFDIINVNTKKRKNYHKHSTKHLKITLVQNINNSNSNKYKREFIEIMLILSQNISSKQYFKLFTFKISPLFNYENSFFIIFDGIYYQHKDTIITTIKDSKEIIFAVSDPKLEINLKSTYFYFEKYILWQNNHGYLMSKQLSYKISLQLFNINILITKDQKKKKNMKKI